VYLNEKMLPLPEKIVLLLPHFNYQFLNTKYSRNLIHIIRHEEMQ